MKPLLVFLALVVLAVSAPTVAQWLTPHPQHRDTARKNREVRE